MLPKVRRSRRSLLPTISLPRASRTRGAVPQPPSTLNSLVKLDGHGRRRASLAHLGGEDSKLLFKVLAEWNHALSHTSIASDIAPANGNAPHGTVKSLESQLEGSAFDSAFDNVIGVDLTVRRPPRPTDRSPKVRVPNDDSVEAGHG